MKEEERNVLNLALCEGRHAIPEATDGAIFGNEIVDPTNISKLEKEAFHAIWYKCFQKKYNENAGKGYLKTAPNWDGCDEEPMQIYNVHINLYVTGLTVALIAVINAMRAEDVTITLWHYNKETGEYYPQELRKGQA